MLDPISDMLTRIRNAQSARKSSVIIPASKLKKAVAQVMNTRGFIGSVREISIDEKPALELELKYEQIGPAQKRPLIHEIRRVSKEGQRMYVNAQEIHRVKNGLGIAIISTSKGVVSGEEARKLGVGGEYICYLW